jgi:hypothetical protein
MTQNGGRGRNHVPGASPNHAPLAFPGCTFSVPEFNDVAMTVRRPAGESRLPPSALAWRRTKWCRSIMAERASYYQCEFGPPVPSTAPY